MELACAGNRISVEHEYHFLDGTVYVTLVARTDVARYCPALWPGSCCGVDCGLAGTDGMVQQNIWERTVDRVMNKFAQVCICMIRIPV